MKQEEEKNFIGMTTFRTGFYNFYPEIINEERKMRTLFFLYWKYESNLVTITQEKLVYDSKDLLAWLGGALGIFVGYSFFDLLKFIIDIVFNFMEKKKK